MFRLLFCLGGSRTFFGSSSCTPTEPGSPGRLSVLLLERANQPKRCYGRVATFGARTTLPRTASRSSGVLLRRDFRRAELVHANVAGRRPPIWGSFGVLCRQHHALRVPSCAPPRPAVSSIAIASRRLASCRIAKSGSSARSCDGDRASAALSASGVRAIPRGARGASWRYAP